jgi:hypothetical protein
MGNNNVIFVFGSNESGIHGGGAAKTAFDKYGAIWSKGFGVQGCSFAIPTKDWDIQTLSLDDIAFYIRRFWSYTCLKPNFNFHITRIGCGLAGYNDEDIAPMFNYVSWRENCYFDEKWREFLPDAKFWGTF